MLILSEVGVIEDWKDIQLYGRMRFLSARNYCRLLQVET